MAVSGDRKLVVEGEQALPILRALDSDTRLLMLSLLTHNNMNVSELATALGLANSTVSTSLKLLEGAGLLHVQYVPGTRGSQKLVTKRYDVIEFHLPGAGVATNHDTIEISMPVGNYRRFEVSPTCGLASDTKFIGTNDDPRSFYEPEHVFAQLLWFRMGFVEYSFPNNLPYGAETTEFTFSAELCSEAPQYDLDWPSDITVWVNNIEVGTWTSPSDFGGERGRLTPAWWPEDQTMYGLLKSWRVTGEGSFLDGERFSDVTVMDLKLGAANHIDVRLEVKANAEHVGGLNLFGRRCGNHPQDLLVQLHYVFPEGHKAYKLK